MALSEEQALVLTVYTKKLLTKFILPTVAPILSKYERDLKEVYIEPQVVNYLAVKNMVEGDFSFLICTYNLYQYNSEGLRIPFVTNEKTLLNRGSLVSAVSISYTDTKLLFGNEIVEEIPEVTNDLNNELETETSNNTKKEPEKVNEDVSEKGVEPENKVEDTDVENKDSVEEEKPEPKVIIQDEIMAYVQESISNLKGLKVKGKPYVINGISQKPVIQVNVKPVNEIMLVFRVCMEDAITGRIVPEIYKKLVADVISHKEKQSDSFYKIDILDMDIAHNGKLWQVLYKIKVTDAKHNKVVLTTDLVLNTPIKDAGDKYKPQMLEFLQKNTKVFLSKSRTTVIKHTDKSLSEGNAGIQDKELNGDKTYKTSIAFKNFQRITNEVDTLRADDEQTKYVFERVNAIFEKYTDEKIIKDVKIKENLLFVTAYSRNHRDNLNIIIGGEGVYVEGYAYTRKGLDNAGDKKFATDYLHNQLGFNIIWADLMDCYDFRKNITKGE